MDPNDSATADQPHVERRISRRWALAAGGAATATAITLSRPDVAAASHYSCDDDGAGKGVEPNAGKWRTFALASPREFKVASPPSSSAARRELDVVIEANRNRTPEIDDAILFWDTGSPSYRWAQIQAQFVSADPSPDTFRVAAYTMVAVYDATIAAWAAKQRYRRRRPPYRSSKIHPLVPLPESPSYPSEHGATAGAAVAVLSHLFPTRVVDLDALAAAQRQSRIAAGVEFPSDFDAGYELGRDVGMAVVERLINGDGFGAPYPGDPNVAYPGGDGSYPLTPAEDGAGIMIGKWRPLVLDDPTAFLPPPPPAKDSAQRAAELADVKAFDRRNPPQFSELFFWALDPAGRPEPNTGAFVNTTSAAFYYALDVAFIALDELNQKVLEYRLNPPRAARAYALTFAALYDAYIACWFAKYHYLVGRPVHFDATIDTLWTTYPLAAYPSGHSTNMTSTATMLGYLFPRDAQYFLSRAKENAASRYWAGIHFTSDFTAGVAMGQAVGNAVIEWAKRDGS